MYKGLLRIKCIEVANHAIDAHKMENLPEGIQCSTEGMETVHFHPEVTETLEQMQEALEQCCQEAIDRLGDFNTDLCTLLKTVKNALIDRLIDQTFYMQFRYPNCPYVEAVIIEDTGE